MPDEEQKPDALASWIATTLRKRGSMLTHTVTLVMLSGLLGLNTGVLGDTGFASRSYVADFVGKAIEGSTADLHEYVDARVTQNSERIDRNSEQLAEILEISTLEQLERFLRRRCMGDLSNDDVIRKLEQNYRRLTGIQYIRPACDDLLR